ncbi:hypothetical protein [Elioraea rosea]|uniref:hypothetical protein n=1 Tax=Elioraea rosea TaxID=2492390 RepID=UPI0011861E3E|nr:hypothetical protein [Elioraea rosea]
MKAFIPTLAGAAMLAFTASASESWTDIPNASGPLMTGTITRDAGGTEAMPEFSAGSGRHETAEAGNVVVTAGDRYDVIPFAFLGRPGAPAPIAVAEAQRQPGGG